MVAVIAGATGLVGSLVLEELLEHPQISQVISVSRRRINTNNLKLVQVLIENFTPLPDEFQLLKGDIYFCCLGTTIRAAGSQENFRKIDHDVIVNFGKVAKNSNAKSFVLISAMGANSQSSIFYNRVKGETEDSLKELHLNNLTIYRPGLLIGQRNQSRPVEKFAIAAFNMLSYILPTKLEKMIATRAHQLSHRIVQSGINPIAGVHVIPSSDI